MSPGNQRILIVDDNHDIHNDFRKILERNVKKEKLHLNSIESQLFGGEEDGDSPLVTEFNVEYELDFADQGEEAVAMVEKAMKEGSPYALIFMDVRMPPGIDGIEAISRIWLLGAHVEVVICTAYSDYSHDRILERLGSSDQLLFLTKPFDSIVVKQMALSLTHKWELHEDARRNVLLLEEEIAQRKASEHRLHLLVNQDVLTELPNRLQLQTKLQEAIIAARESRTRFALFFIGLERFKDVIDTLGYQIGDKLVLQIAQRLREGFASGMSIYRLDDDEFALLLPEIVSIEQTQAIAKQIKEIFEPHFDLEGLNVEVYVNTGIVIYPDHGSSDDMLLRRAVSSLEQARNSEFRFRFFMEEREPFHSQRLKLLSELRQAIRAGELMLYYQPRVNRETNRITGVEALLRWPNMRIGFVPPAKFIPFAERCSLMKPLTEWVLNEAARQWAVWKKRGWDLTISINITAHDLKNPNLTSEISTIAEAHGMPLQSFMLEISEKHVMENPEEAIAIMRILEGMGLRLAIDNFGTGYSSLTYLKKLPVKEIRIDPSFLEDIKMESSHLAIVRSMIDLGHNLGFDVMAGGVGSREAFDVLKSYGCDWLQGYYIHEPVPAGELSLWLNQTDWQIATGPMTGALARKAN